MFKKTWNPYLAGALAGILLILSVWISGKFFGTSTTFVRVAAVVEESIGIDTSSNAYFTAKKGKYGAGALPDWQLMFVIGALLGAFISSRLSGDFKLQMVPDMWQKRFGPSPVKRGVTAFFGGVIALFGARLAGGWPSGHGLSGLAQLSTSGFISLAGFFLVGAVIANLIYRGKGGRS